MPWPVRASLDKLRLAVTPRVALGVGVFAFAVVAFRIAHQASGAWEIDDAGITDAAALQLADHHSLAPYLEGPPVESYSNPLVFFVIASLRMIGRFDPVSTHVVLEAALFGMMSALVWSLIAGWLGKAAATAATVAFVALELLTPATWLWYGSGLENVWVACGVVFLLWSCARTARGVPYDARWGNVAALVALTRPEAPVYVAGYYVVLAAVARPDGQPRVQHLARVLRGAVVTGALYVVFLVWRHHAYGAWLPNTYYAKLAGQSDPIRNLREYVIPVVFTYGQSALLVGCGITLLLVRRLEVLGLCLFAFAIITLALPIAAGADFMGEQRFATPFLAIAHVVYAVFAGVCVARLIRLPRRRWRLAHAGAIVVALVPLALFALGHLAVIDDIPLSTVSVPHVALVNGAARWEHQMRLGVPNAVVMTPDVGGALLVGGMQLVDNGYLADVETPRMARGSDDPGATAALDQYELVERRADLVDDNPYFPIDRTKLGTDYIAGPARMYARRDLVELAAVDPAAQILYDSPDLRVLLSPATVLTAAPGGLVRLELIVAWTDTIPQINDAITVDDGDDHDELTLHPYVVQSGGIERRALLIGAPPQVGAAPATLTIYRAGKPVAKTQPLSLDVTRDRKALAAAAARTEGASPLEAARRLAWLREQMIPRLGMYRFHVLEQALDANDHAHAARAGHDIMKLRWNARLDATESLPSVLDEATKRAERRLLDTCPHDVHRVACLGRAIDDLRRLGYLDVLAQAPNVSRELAEARDHLANLPLPERYTALVGLVLAIPSDIALHRELIDARAALSPQFPAM